MMTRKNNEILSLLSKRRSHFRKEFTGEKIEDSKIEYLLECAHQAPSHKLTFPWHFIVFSDKGLQQLAEKLIAIEEKKDTDPIKKSNAIENFQRLPTEVSHAIAICMKRDDLKRVPESEELFATVCAVQNMYIGLLEFEDIGGYWGTGANLLTTEMHSFLNLKEEDKCIGYFFVGKLKQKRTESSRPNWKNNTHWIKE